MRFIKPRLIFRSTTSWYRSSSEMVMSAISRAMAAPSLMAMPASDSERAGLSFTPSPTMITLWPASRSCRTKEALSSGSTPARYSSTPTIAATAAAVRSLSPVIITTRLMPSSRRAFSTSGASARRESSMQITAASLPPMARYRWEYWAGSAATFSLSFSEHFVFSSSNTK